MTKHLLFATASAMLLSCFLSGAAFAQSQQRKPAQSSQGSENLDDLFGDTGSDQGTAQQPAQRPQQQQPRADVLPEEPRGPTDLGKLEPFSDIAVIQKRFLPLTKRYEGYIAPSMIMNDAFFMSFGANARLAYYLSERWGAEGVFTYLMTSQRQVTTDLREKRNVDTKSFVTPTMYYGLDLKWTPIYGKMTWRNKKITPFDLYFSLGFGMTGTNQGTSEPTLHLGTGQLFAISKSSAWRWDFSWNAFTAESSVDRSLGRSLYHNLFLNIGWSFLFPEATYR